MNSPRLSSYHRPRLSSFYRRCRCYTCIAHPHNAALLRRPGTTKLGQWRKLTTLFYSSLFATAAAADVQVKSTRRQQWAAAIAAAEREVEQGRTAQHQPAAGTLATEWTRAYTGSATKPDYGDQPLDPRVALIRALKSVGVSAVPVPLGLLGLDPGPGSIYASEYMKTKESQWTPKKLMLIELAMAKLALRFSIAIPDVDQSNSGMDDGYCRTLKSMLKKITHKLECAKMYTSLSPDPTSRPGLPCYSPNQRTGSPSLRNQALDAALLKIAFRFTRGRCSLPEYLAQTSQNILACRQPPEASSMTIILNVLSQGKHFELANAVCQCIFESPIRPDEMCIDAMVNHYVAANDEAGFDYLTRKINGYHGGLALARNGVQITPNSARRLHRYNGKIIQLPVKDKVLWHSMLRGHLYFKQAYNAVRAFRDMILAGLTINASEMNGLLDLAAQLKDWELGLDFWRFMKPSRLKETSREDHAFVRHVLRLCESCGPLGARSKISSWLSEQGFSTSALADPQPTSKLELSREVELLRRNVRILARKVEVENVRFQRRARLVVGTQMRLVGLSKEQVKDLFDGAKDLVEGTDYALDSSRQLYVRYTQRVKRARGIWRRFVSREQHAENLTASSRPELLEKPSKLDLVFAGSETTENEASDAAAVSEYTAYRQPKDDGIPITGAADIQQESNFQGTHDSTWQNDEQSLCRLRAPLQLRGLNLNETGRSYLPAG